MQYSDVTTQLNTYWNGAAIARPTFLDKNLVYNIQYPHRLFINVYKELPIEEISKDNLFKRKQYAEIHGVYSNYTDAAKSLKECTRVITLHDGWRLGGKSQVIQKQTAYIFILNWFEIAFLKGGEW